MEGLGEGEVSWLDGFTTVETVIAFDTIGQHEGEEERNEKSRLDPRRARPKASRAILHQAYRPRKLHISLLAVRPFIAPVVASSLSLPLALLLSAPSCPANAHCFHPIRHYAVQNRLLPLLYALAPAVADQ